MSIHKRIFSVMQRRDDLPEMTTPLAVLLSLLTAVFSLVSAKLITSVSGDGDIYSSVGAVVALCLIPISVCFYSLIILLWRKLVSLVVTPISFLIMLFCGADLFSAVTVSFTVLLCSYTYAVSLISRESAFRRMTSLSVALGACTVIAVIGYVGLNFASFDGRGGHAVT